VTRPFLTARWENVFLVSYRVPPALLKPRLPAGLELDTRGGDAFVSLVAFEFLDTRVLRVRWPGCTNFAELNLRFYVRHGDERGVVFVREIVPPQVVVWAARLLYNEPYRAALLTAARRDDDTSRSMEFRLGWAGREHRVSVTGAKPSFVPGEKTDEHFFKEHHWGFGRTLRYRVDHPAWAVFPVQDFRVELDWQAVYGPEWGFLSGAAPCATCFAAGSEVAVYPKGALPDA
jgi:hypothetical protein